MLFRISSLPNETVSKDQDLFLAFVNLIKSYGELKHLVWMGREVSKFILENFDFNEYEKRVIQAIDDRHLELGRFHRELEVYFEIDFDNKFRKEYDDEASCFYIGYGLVSDSSYVQATKLLVEAYFDFEMSKHAALTWIYRNKSYSNTFSCEFDFVNGGGGNLFRVYQRAVDRRDFFFCLIDGDKRHPSDSYGSTAGNVSRNLVDRDRNHQVHIIDATEMENIIPLKILEEAIHEKGNKGVSKEMLLDMARSEHRQYFDHKLGMKVETARKFEEGLGIYWSDSEFYDEDGEWICKGFGINIGDHCLEVMNKSSPVKNASCVCENKDSYWLFLGKLLFSWGVVFKRRVV